MPKDSRNSTLVVAATSGFQDLQGCSDSSRQGAAQMALVIREAVPTFTQFIRGAAWPPGLLLSVTLAASPLLSLPLGLPVLSALWS